MTLYYPVASAANKAVQRRRFFVLSGTLLFRLCRLAGTFAAGVIVLRSPDLGAYHAEVGWLLMLGIAPLSVLLDYWAAPRHRLVMQTAFDLAGILICCMALPGLWVPTLVLGTLIVASGVPHFALTHKILGFVLPTSFIVAMAMLAQHYEMANTWYALLAAALGTPFCLLFAVGEQRREQELRDRSHLMDSLSRMAGGIGHDFNNLLTAIQGNAELAEQKLDRNHVARPLVQALLKESQKAQLFSAQLLAFSGGVATGRERLDVRAELLAIAGLLESALPRGVQLDIHAESHLPLVSANRAQLQEILVASILHVADAINRASGEVEVTLRKVARRHGNELVLQLRGSHLLDSTAAQGRSVSEQSLASVRFGLPAVQRIMREHDGDIEMHGSWRDGVVIALRLPGLPDTKAASIRPRAPGPVVPRHVLLLESAAEVHAVVRSLLVQLGHRVTSAKAERIALAAIAADTSIDLVMLGSPPSGTQSLLEQIDAIRPGLPALLSKSLRELSGGELERSNVNYVAKPYSSASLNGAIQRFFN